MTHRLIVDGELVLYGPVGFFDFWDEDGFTAADVVNALAEIDGDVTVRLNSGGGIATEGAAIYNALSRHDGAVTIVIDGIAASAASLLAMAGDTIEMPLGSLMMIHEPAGISIGPADSHRKTAKVLDTMASVYAEVYAARSGLSETEVRSLMKEEIWLSPAEAVDKGFADAETEAAAATADASFDYGTYRHAPASLKALAEDRQAHGLPMVAVASAPTSKLRKEPTMSKNAPAPADMNAPATTATAAAAAPAPAPEPAAPAPAPAETAASPAPAANIDVTAQIYARCTAAKMTLAEANEIVVAAAGSMDKAKDLILDKIAARDPDGGQVSHQATITADARDRFAQGVEKSLLHKTGQDGGERNEFTSLTMLELARMSLQQAGVTASFRDKMTMVGAALGMPAFMAAGQHSTSDFANVLANVANKSMLKGYGEAGEVFDRFTARGNLPDFKSAKRIDLSAFPTLNEVPEGGEYQYATIGDRGETIQLATYGRMFAITRQAIINDDMDAFSKVPMKMGRAAHRTVGNLVFAVITANGAMSDGTALFHADHGNLGSGVITTANVDAGRAAMAKQTEGSGEAQITLNIRPAYFLVPVALQGLAITTMASQFEIISNKNATTPNYVRDMAEVIADARLDANSTAAWYLASDPNVNDTIEVAYLDGNDQPYLEQRAGWNVDGVEFKVRHDAGVKALDWKGLYKSSGS